MPESSRQRALIHLVGVGALAASVAYLAWRLVFTLGGDLWLAIPMWLLELHAVLGLALYTFSLWDIDAEPPAPPVRRTSQKVAVLIPTYDEKREVLLPTIAAAVSIEPAHETWVLDDGQRPWVRHLAAELGARYLSRPDRSNAKSGNLNYALARVDADLVAVLDADHVPTPDFLVHTLGYFDDPAVAVVQTPQDFYNVGSFEHGRNRSFVWRRRRSIAFNEQRLFYRAIQPGKNRWNAAFWCGTSAVVRTAALKDVGGVAHESLTEDILTTIRIHRRGWRTVFHNEVLAHGLAARDVSQYQTQRARWGVGAMQVLRLEQPLTRRGLSLRQRLAYATTLLGWFDAWRTLGYVLLPVLVMLSGALPVQAPLTSFAPWFGAVFVAQRISLALLARGYAPQGMATLFDFIRMPTNLAATLSLLHTRERSFQVTRKAGYAERHRGSAPFLLWSLLGATGLALLWFALTLAGWTPVTYHVRWAAEGAALWSVVNAGFLGAAILRIRSDRFAADRRNGERLKVGGLVLVNDSSAELTDFSVGGALLRVPQGAPEPGGPVTLEFPWSDLRIRLTGRERHRIPVGEGGALLSVEFDPGQDRELAQISRVAFAHFGRHRAPVPAVPVPVPAA